MMRKDGRQVFLEMKERYLHISGDRVAHFTTLVDELAFTWRHLRDFRLSFHRGSRHHWRSKVLLALVKDVSAGSPIFCAAALH